MRRSNAEAGIPAPDESQTGQRFRISVRSAAVTGAVAGAFALGVFVGGGFPGGDAIAESSLTGNATFATLEETWELIHAEWPDPEAIDDDALIYGAARGMIDAIGDEGHSAFLDPEMAVEFAQAREGEFVGIGVEVDARCGVPMISRTMPGSPAREAGLQPGDIIAAVDDVPTRRMAVDGLRELILGSEGDTLTLTIERPAEDATLDIEVARRTIQVDPVTWRWLPDKTVHLRIEGFEPGVAQEVRQALDSARQQGAERLILDLRGNPGGLVPEVIGVASQFMDEGKTVFLEQRRDREPAPMMTVGRDGKWLDLALVVLIDEGSASGAEVLAAALRDNGRAELIGETTFGTGTVLGTYPQSDGSSVVLGNAFWLTPEGEHIWKQGVEPDRVIPLERDALPSQPEDDAEVTDGELQALTDTQLQEGFEALAGATIAS